MASLGYWYTFVNAAGRLQIMGGQKKIGWFSWLSVSNSLASRLIFRRFDGLVIARLSRVSLFIFRFLCLREPQTGFFNCN
jgi:hypothetical protein